MKLLDDNESRPPGKQFVRDLEDGAVVDSHFLVTGREIRKKKSGEDYLALTLADSSGTVKAVLWDNVAELAEHARRGAVLSVQGSYSASERFGPQIKLRNLRGVPIEGVKLSDLLQGPDQDVSELEHRFRELIKTVKDQHLRALLERLLDPGTESWQRFLNAPAAKLYHQPYRHGLIEHCLSVACAVSSVSEYFPGIDRDLAVTGALLHDIGKTESYTSDAIVIDLTAEGRLQGEIALGYYRVRREIENIPEFPYGLGQRLLHIILSHHGTLENGSPVIPCTREATLVHMIDNLGGTLGSFDRLEKQLGEGEQWSAWDRAIEGFAYFGRD